MLIVSSSDADDLPGNAVQYNHSQNPSSYSAIFSDYSAANHDKQYFNNKNNTVFFNGDNENFYVDATTTTTTVADLSAKLSETTNLTDFQQKTTIRNRLLFLKGLRANLAESMEQCAGALQQSGLPVSPHTENGSKWCNATWDTVLCWPATPANSSITLQCPPLKGLDPTKNITKFCHSSGRWMGKLDGDFSRSHGWTNFTMCFTEEVVYIMKNLNNGSLGIAQDVAQNARKLEFVGLGLSLVSLLLSIVIFSCFRRLRVFRNLLHLQLMIATLMVVIIRLVLYIDLIFTDRLGHVLVNPEGKTINTMVIVCEFMFFLLEYFKSVAFWWMFLEGFYLHNQLVLTVFNTDPKLWPYLITGYGVPLIHTIVWLLVIVYKKQGMVERCLGSYYLEPEFWILDGPRMLQLVVNTFFISNVIRVLWAKVQDVGNTGEVNRMKKSVKAALMLIPLLGIPNIMQTIPFSPTHENITYFAIWTYCASFTYMYQGFMIAMIYCFTNREVQAVMKNYYYRYRLQHTNTAELRRGSRSLHTYCPGVGGSALATTLISAVAAAAATNASVTNSDEDDVVYRHSDSSHNNNNFRCNSKKKNNNNNDYNIKENGSTSGEPLVVRSSSNANGSDTTGYDTGGDVTYRRESSIIVNESPNARLLHNSNDKSDSDSAKRADTDFDAISLHDSVRGNGLLTRTTDHVSGALMLRNGSDSYRCMHFAILHADDDNDGDDEATPFKCVSAEHAGVPNRKCAAHFAHADVFDLQRKPDSISFLGQRT